MLIEGREDSDDEEQELRRSVHALMLRKSSVLSQMHTSQLSQDRGLGKGQEAPIADALKAAELAKLEKLAQNNCEVCLRGDQEEVMLICEGGCDKSWHIQCLTPPLASVPEGKWECTACAAKGGEGGGSEASSGEAAAAADGDSRAVAVATAEGGEAVGGSSADGSSGGGGSGEMPLAKATKPAPHLPRLVEFRPPPDTFYNQKLEEAIEGMPGVIDHCTKYMFVDQRPALVPRLRSRPGRSPRPTKEPSERRPTQAERREQEKDFKASKRERQRQEREQARNANEKSIQEEKAAKRKQREFEREEKKREKEEEKEAKRVKRMKEQAERADAKVQAKIQQKFNRDAQKVTSQFRKTLEAEIQKLRKAAKEVRPGPRRIYKCVHARRTPLVSS